MNREPFFERQPEIQTAPVVINSPHSGRYYPQEFLAESRLGNLAIRRSEDFCVDELVHGAVQCGIPILQANYPRAYVDVNREPFELDPTMFSSMLPEFANTRSVRVSGGLGTIPRVVAEGQEIYARSLDLNEALNRISTIYRPYHNALQGLLARTHVQFGVAILLDFHSMPSSGARGRDDDKPDIILGDRFSTSCDGRIIHHAKAILRELGYQVAINQPYAGGFITEHYGRPENGLHALQIELNRALYMDEIRIEKNSGFAALRKNLETFFARFVELDMSGLHGSQPLAAE